MIFEIFDKIRFALPTLRVVLTPSTLTTANKKKVRVKYFFEKYIHAKFHRNSAIPTSVCSLEVEELGYV